MSTIKCDVLVVGAGPAGSSAARSASLTGAKTIFIDKKEEVGIPVQCAEGIGEYLFHYLPFEIPKEQLIWKIDGMFFWTNDLSIEKTGEFWNGYSIDRRSFDKWLANLAVQQGAELWTNSELIDLDIDDRNKTKKILIKKNGKTIEVHPKVIIAADGCESTVSMLQGLYKPKRGDHAEIYSWEMKNLDLYKPHLEQIFLGDFTPKGYAYIFPKSKHVANVGVGGIYLERELENYFDEFLEIGHIKKQIKNAEYVVEKTKKTPWRSIHDEWVIGNTIFAGDAANQTIKPLGEGILPGMISGNLSGEFAIKMLAGEKPTTKDYLESLKDKLNPYVDLSVDSYKKVNHWFTVKGREKDLLLLSLLSNLFEFEFFEELEQMDYDKLKTRISDEIRVKDAKEKQ
jgi:digeranylgeranylglycerophospholipid reductase